ncbi:MAG: metal-dependent transcriptional regulator [Clostridia bacterium]|nr:metal-dependent transcriptional regulator [Clostridia bacterium]
MKIQESAENYLETILVLNKNNGKVRAIDIVNELGFSKPSVSVAMKQFRENGYINVDQDGYITLTSQGEKIAKDTYNRHLLIINFLTHIGVSEEIATKDACRIEHVISEETFKKLKEYLKKFQQG